MPNHEVQVDSYGWNLDLRVVDEQAAPIDISAGTTLEYMAKKPGANGPIAMTATFVTDGTDGKLRHVVTSGEIDTIGTWQIQTHVVMPTAELYSAVMFFEVKANV
jgi:hypothetical protein